MLVACASARCNGSGMRSSVPDSNAAVVRQRLRGGVGAQSMQQKRRIDVHAHVGAQSHRGAWPTGECPHLVCPTTNAEYSMYLGRKLCGWSDGPVVRLCCASDATLDCTQSILPGGPHPVSTGSTLGRATGTSPVVLDMVAKQPSIDGLDEGTARSAQHATARSCDAAHPAAYVRESEL